MAELPEKLELVVVTRERKLLEGTADEVVLPGMNGYFGVLPGHTPLLAILRVGAMMFREGGVDHRFVLTGGLAEVLPNRVIVIAYDAYSEDEIDAAEAERQREEAERELAGLASHDPEFAVAEAKLEESVAKIQIISRHVH